MAGAAVRAQEMGGVLEQPIAETPIAVVDFEATGPRPDEDHVIEVAVVRLEPSGSTEAGAWFEESRVVLDSVIAPAGGVDDNGVGASHVHKLTTDDLVGAPAFEALWPELEAALGGAVFAAYNVLADVTMLETALGRAAIEAPPLPTLCALRVRTMAGLGRPVGLGKASAKAGIEIEGRHSALGDALATAELVRRSMAALAERNVVTWADLRRVKRHTYMRTLANGLWPVVETPTASVAKQRRQIETHAATGQTQEAAHE
ncbi:MAG: 3'-5' exonuclease [Planctomycetota bacterium]